MSLWPAVAEIAAKVQTGELKAADLVELSLKKIKEKEDYRAIISTIEDRARARAKEVDSKVASGEFVGKLAGVPFIAKDNFLTFGSETTAASNILKGFKAPYQASVIDKLESEGAICVAKANLDAFGHGASTENSDFMITKNPYDKTRVPGGSSGGSTTAVVLEMAPFALGTDTGGSSRQPASLSGCIGFRPTYGLISRSGVVAMASSMDTIGTLARTVADLTFIMDIIAEKDGLDSTMIERDPRGYLMANDRPSAKGIKVGVVKEYMGEGLDSGVKAKIEEGISRIKASGVEITEISLASLPLSLAAYYIICPAEISSNLSRYDGQRYGYSDSNANNLEDSYSHSRATGFGKEAKRRIMIGTYVLSSGYYDAYYRKAQTVRTKLIREFENAFKEVDFMLGPVSPTTAFRISENTNDPLSMYLVDVMTVAASLVGIPAISIPAGFCNGLPVGLQLMAPQRHDYELLTLSSLIEEVLV